MMDKHKYHSPNLYRQQGLVSIEERTRVFGQKPFVFWFTGLSGSGKTSIAIEFERRLFDRKALVCHLDADDLRRTVNADLGFSDEDREKNIRRAAGVARILQDAGLIVLATFITPTESSRANAREIVREGLFCEVYVKAALETCIARDPKGFYARALRGEIENYTGIESLYEEPTKPDLLLDTDRNEIDDCVSLLMKFTEDQGIFDT